MEDFIHLHVHSYYSILDGQSSIKRLVDKAVGNGMRGMALTDHGDMFGVKELFDYCNKVNGSRKKQGLEPFKPIFGCEMYVAHRKKEQREAIKVVIISSYWPRTTMVIRISSNLFPVHGWTVSICVHVLTVKTLSVFMRT